MIKFSASTNGFYDEAIHTPEQIPSDAVDITVEWHIELLNGQSSGMAIGSDDVGNPILTTPPIVNSTRVTRAQGKKQLIVASLYDEVKAWVDNEASEMCRIGFYDEPYWLIEDEFIQEAKVKFNLTDEKVQELFNLASKI